MEEYIIETEPINMTIELCNYFSTNRALEYFETLNKFPFLVKCLLVEKSTNVII